MGFSPEYFGFMAEIVDFSCGLELAKKYGNVNAFDMFYFWNKNKAGKAKPPLKACF